MPYAKRAESPNPAGVQTCAYDGAPKRIKLGTGIIGEFTFHFPAKVGSRASELPHDGYWADCVEKGSLGIAAVMRPILVLEVSAPQPGTGMAGMARSFASFLRF